MCWSTFCASWGTVKGPERINGIQQFVGARFCVLAGQVPSVLDRESSTPWGSAKKGSNNLLEQVFALSVGDRQNGSFVGIFQLASWIVKARHAMERCSCKKWPKKGSNNLLEHVLALPGHER